MNNSDTRRVVSLDAPPIMPTALIMAGGTGGHVFPGLAVANALRAAQWNVLWMGAPKGMEATLVPKHDIEMVFINFGGVRGKGVLTKLLAPFKLLRAVAQSWSALRRIRPQVVVSMGGYIALPGGLATRLTGTPLIVHEQNSVAGMTNQVLAKFARAKLVAFPNALKDATWTGNPVRAEIVAIAAPQARFAGRSGPLRVLVVGGSLGAQALNTVVPQALALLPSAARPQVTHQAGAKEIDTLRANYAAVGVTADCVAFIDDMALAYAACDVLICRAGAMTVSEVAAAGVAAVFVPFPHAVDNHQTGNAKFLADAHAARLLPQAELTPQALATLLQGLTRDALLAMATKARALGKPDSTAQVAQICIDHSTPLALTKKTA